MFAFVRDDVNIKSRFYGQCIQLLGALKSEIWYREDEFRPMTLLTPVIVILLPQMSNVRHGEIIT